MADFSITGEVRLNSDPAEKSLSSWTVAVGNLISGTVKAATGKLAELTAASVNVGMKFESSMSQVAATMGTSVDQIQNLTDVAKEMGSKTAFSASQAADALNYLALAGYDADKAAEVLPSVLNLAAAGGLDLAYASDLVTDAMASLNIEASKENVEDFGDKLAMTSSKANTSVGQLGEAMLTVGGTAANLKGGTTELTTALGLLANVGLKGAEGGTHLRNIILSLQSPTDTAAKLMDQLGLNVYDAQGNMRGLDEILTDLNTSMNGMTQGGKDSVINQLFNKTDLAAVNGLLAAQGEQWDTLEAQIDSAGGAMEQMADTQLDNLQGSITIMQSALESLQLGFYQYLEPTLNEAAKWGSECLSTLSESLEEGGPEAMLKAAGTIIGDLVSGIAAKLPGMVTAGVQLIESIGQGAVEAIPDFLSKALPLLSDFASGLRENAGKLIDAGIDLILNLMQGLMDGLPTLIEYLPDIVSDLAGIINDNAPKLLAAGVQLIIKLGEGLLKAVPTIIENIPQICKAIFDVFTAFRWLDIGSHIVEGMWNGLKSGWTGLISKVQGLAQQLPDIVKKVLGIHSPSKVFSEIGMQTCAGLAEGLTNGNTKVKDAAKTVVASVTDTATEIIDGVTKTTQTVTETMLNGATQQKQVVTETSQQIIDGTEKTVKKVTTIAADGSKTVTQTMEDVKATVVSTVKDTQTSVVDGVQTTVEKTTKTLSDGSEQIETITTTTGKEIIDGVERTVKTVTTMTADGVETSVKTIEDSGVQFSSSGEMVVSQLDDALNDAWNDVNDSIQTDVFGSVQTLVKAIEDGDLESIAKWTAGIFYGSLTDEQKKQIQTFAINAANQLADSLSGVFTNLASLASGLVGQFVPATDAAAAAQGILNTVLEANPILAVISVVGLLIAAFVKLAKTNKDVGNAFKSVWQGVQDFMSVIFETLLRIVAVAIQGFVNTINGLIDIHNFLAPWDKKGHVTNPATDLADSIKSDREKRQKEREAQAAAEKAQAELDKKYAEESGEAEKKQLEAKYQKKLADLEKAKLSSDSPEMLAAEKKVAQAEYQQSLADLEKKLLDAEYSKVSAEIEKKTTTDETKLAELEKKITEAENTIKTGDLEKQLLKVDYENDLKDLEAKYTKGSAAKTEAVTKSIIDSVTDTTKTQNADGSETTIKTVTDTIKDSTGKIYQQVTKTITETGTKLVNGVEKTYTRTTTLVDGVQQKVDTVLSDVQKKAETSLEPAASKPNASSGSSSSDDTAKKISDLKASYDQKLADLKADYAEKQKNLESKYDQKLTSLEKEQSKKDEQYQTKLDNAKSDYERQLENLKTEYDRKLASLEKELDKKTSSDAPSESAPTPPDPSQDDLTDAVIDNTEAILSTNKTLAEMVKKANTLVLSDNMQVSSKVAASGTAKIAAAANVYNNRSGDTIVQNIYSKSQTAADLARETRWEADRAKAQKH